MFRTDPGENLTPVDDVGGQTIYYDEDRESYHTWCDDADYEPTSTAVVIGVTSVLEVDPDDLATLSNAVDPGALDALVAHWRRDDIHGGGAVTFPFASCTVTVRSSGEVVIEPTEDRASPVRS